MKDQIVYYNLGQCTGDRICYLRSTDVERNNWHRLLWSVSDEMLYFLSIGKRICIMDASTHTKGKIERIAIPVIKALMEYLYLGKEMENKYLLPSLKLAYKALREDNSLYKKYKFWKNRIKNIDFTVITNMVEKEPNTIYKREEV